MSMAYMRVAIDPFTGLASPRPNVQSHHKIQWLPETARIQEGKMPWIGKNNVYQINKTKNF